MRTGCVLQFSWVVFLLLLAADSHPVRNSQTRGFLYGHSGGGRVFGGGAPSGPGKGLSGEEPDIYEMIADTMSHEPERSFQRYAWTSDHVPLGLVEERPSFPSSHVVKSSSLYQRARDFRSDAKYTQDTFDHIPLPETQRGSQMTKDVLR